MAAALVSERGIGKAVAQHHFAARQGRPDDLGNVVASGGKNQQRLGQSIHGRVQHHLAKLFRQRGSAGLARDADDVGRSAHSRRHGVDMGGFAGTVNAFHADKKSVHAAYFLRWYRSTARLCSSSVALNWLLPSPRATKYRALDGAGCTAASKAVRPGMAIGVGGNPARV